MAGLSVKVVVALTALAYGFATKTDYELNVIKHGIIERETLLAANAIRKITIKTPECKVQLATMAADCIVAIQNAQYNLNNVIPDIVSEVAAHKDLSQYVEFTSLQAYEIQQHIVGDSEKLKETLVKSLEAINKTVKKHHEDVKTAPNSFAFNQLNRAHDFIIYGIYKLKHQATLFDTPNKDLATEVTAGFNKLIEVLNSITSTDKTIEEEFSRILQQVSSSTANIIKKLENWVELNSNKPEVVKTIQEVIIEIVQIYDTTNRALNENHSLADVKNLLVKNTKTGDRLAKIVAETNYGDSLGVQEFIRSGLFDAMTIGYAYADILSAVSKS